MKKTLLKKENTGRNTSTQVWGVTKAEQGQNWTKPETRQEIPWVGVPTVLFSCWNLSCPGKSHCRHSCDSRCCSHQDTASQGWSGIGTGLVCHWDRAAHSLATSHTQFLQPLFVSQFFWCRNRNSSLTSLPQVPGLVTSALSSGVSVTLRKRYCELLDPAGARQGWIKQGLVVLCYPSLLFLMPSNALTFPKNSSHWLLRIQKFIMARKTWSIQPEFSYPFRDRCYLYSIFSQDLGF